LSIELSIGGLDGDRDFFVAGTFESVQPGPVCGKVGGFEGVDLDGLAVRVEDQGWVAESGAQPAWLKVP